MDRRNFWKRVTFGLLALFTPKQVHATHTESTDHVLLVSKLDVRGTPYGGAEVLDTETGFRGHVSVSDSDGMYGYIVVISGSKTVRYQTNGYRRIGVDRYEVYAVPSKRADRGVWGEW